MFSEAQGSSKKDLSPARGLRSRWFAGAIIGQVLGFTTATVLLAPVVAPAVVVASTLAGGFLGGLAGAKLRSKKSPASVDPIREYIFQALEETSKKLDEMFIEEDFNGAANGNERGPKQAQKAQPRLAPATPAPPRMGGH